MSVSDRGRTQSLEVTGGPAQAAARSMLRAMGWTTEDLQHGVTLFPVAATPACGSDAGLLDGEAMTVTGLTVGEALADVGRSAAPRTPVLHTVADPVKSTGGYAVLWGNLAPDGAVIKVANQAANRHRGAAKVFGTEQEAYGAVSDGHIVPGDVVVVRYQARKAAQACRR